MRKKEVTLEDTLKAKPVRNEFVKQKQWDDGQAFLVIYRKNSRWVRVLSKIFYIPEERKIYLDRIGMWVWHKCDGHTNVAKMIEDLAGEFKINRKEAERSLLSYLKSLAQKRLIGFLMAMQHQESGVACRRPKGK